MHKTVLITGATGSIGQAVVSAFAEAGYSVVAAYFRNEKKARELADSVGASRLRAVQCDVSDSRSVTRLFETAEQAFGGTDVLINCAGNSQFSLLTDTGDKEWEKLRGVHLDGCFYCCRAALPHMIRQKSGAIINISSIWGVTGASCEAAYSAVKAGVIGLTKALAKEAGPSGVTVNCIAPGMIESEMNSRLTEEEKNGFIQDTPLRRIGKPEDVAEMALFLAEKGGFITGQVLSPNGGACI